jgi:hypothetical protein
MIAIQGDGNTDKKGFDEMGVEKGGCREESRRGRFEVKESALFGVREENDTHPEDSVESCGLF